jgi:AAA domain, putative AbiEii toxin, Type IV TA system
MSAIHPNQVALFAAKALLDAASSLELDVAGRLVHATVVSRGPALFPELRGGRRPVGLEGLADDLWPASVRLDCAWRDGSIEIELRLAVWRQPGPWEGYLALQIVTVPSNRELVWIGLTKRLEKAVEAGKPSCSIPASFSLWTRTGERDARPLTDALTRAASAAGFKPLAPTQFHLVDVALPDGWVSPSAAEGFRRLVHAALLKLPFVTRGEEGDLRGNPPFDIRAVRREAAERSASAPPAEPLPVPEPSVSSSQENVFFSFIGVSDFGPFDHFEWNEMAKINVIVGENDTGKSHLLKLMYALARGVEDFTARLGADRPSFAKALADKLVWTFEPLNGRLGGLVRRTEHPTVFAALATLCNEEYRLAFGPEAGADAHDFGEVSGDVKPQPELHALFIPPKEILTSLNAITLVRERRSFGFDDTYVDLVRAVNFLPVEGVLPDEMQQVLGRLDTLLGGRIVTEEGRFFFVRGAEKYGMSHTAEGIKKIGILARLLQNGELRRNAILFLDEPEVNLHPKAARVLVRMLFDLSRAGVQIFTATHSYFVLKQFEILARGHHEPVMLCSLARRPAGAGIEARFADLRKGLPETAIGDEALSQYDEDVEVSWNEGA